MDRNRIECRNVYIDEHFSILKNNQSNILFMQPIVNFPFNPKWNYSFTIGNEPLVCANAVVRWRSVIVLYSLKLIANKFQGNFKTKKRNKKHFTWKYLLHKLPYVLIRNQLNMVQQNSWIAISAEELRCVCFCLFATWHKKQKTKSTSRIKDTPSSINK